LIKTVIIKLYVIKLRIVFKPLTNKIIVTTMWDVFIFT